MHSKCDTEKSGKFRCGNIFVVPVNYKIKYHEILKIYNGEVLEHARVWMYVRTAVWGSLHVRESLTTLLPTSFGFIVYSSD